MSRVSRRRVWTRRLLAAAGFACLVVSAPSAWVAFRYHDRIVDAQSAPAAPVAMVFGAGLSQNNEPSPVLAERLDVAIGLYRAQKVKKLLLSGDNSERYHDETSAMARYALENGVPPEDLIKDGYGLSTYDSCYRAHQVFGIDRALLVTQAFHLPRALFIANSLGIDAHGVPADAERGRGDHLGSRLRELFSRPLALLMVLSRAEPASSAP